jgi:hypothetical protein
MQKTPDWYAKWRVALGFDTVEYGGFGLELLQPDEVPAGQLGYSVTTDGKSLVGDAPGDWQPGWLVIGCETACGDPIFASHESPHAVFTAMHGEGSWEPTLVAQSLDVFAQCLRTLQRFAVGRSTPVEVEAKPPRAEEQAQFLQDIRTLTNDDQGALDFWAVRVDIDLDAFNE